jgi:hypothetical protein
MLTVKLGVQRSLALPRVIRFCVHGAHKLFNLSRSNECSPNGSTRRVPDRARFTHEPFMIFAKHGVAAVNTANFMNAKADERISIILKFVASLAGVPVGLTKGRQRRVKPGNRFTLRHRETARRRQALIEADQYASRHSGLVGRSQHDPLLKVTNGCSTTRTTDPANS